MVTIKYTVFRVCNVVWFGERKSQVSVGYMTSVFMAEENLSSKLALRFVVCVCCFLLGLLFNPEDRSSIFL
jgi:hypothetical protein